MPMTRADAEELAAKKERELRESCVLQKLDHFFVVCGDFMIVLDDAGHLVVRPADTATE